MDVQSRRSKSGLEPTGDCDLKQLGSYLPIVFGRPNQDSSRQAIVTRWRLPVPNEMISCPNQDSSRQAIVTQ